MRAKTGCKRKWMCANKRVRKTVGTEAFVSWIKERRRRRSRARGLVRFPAGEEVSNEEGERMESLLRGRGVVEDYY